MFVAKQRPETAGVYRASADVRINGHLITAPGVSLLVGGADSEMTDPRLNLRVLQRVASASGGRLVQPAEIAGLANQLRAAVPAAFAAARRDLWHNGWSFALIVSLLVLEWMLRRKWGLR